MIFHENGDRKIQKIGFPILTYKSHFISFPSKPTLDIFKSNEESLKVIFYYPLKGRVQLRPGIRIHPKKKKDF